MLKLLFSIALSCLVIAWLKAENIHADNPNPLNKTVQYSPGPMIDIDRRPDTEDILRTPLSKIEYITSQVTGIGYGRPGTEEYLNAEILIKLKDDTNIYGFSLVFTDSYGHGTSKAIFDTLLAAFVNDLKVEILYYKKNGAKQLVRVTVRK
ncbi:MAG: hypothetical protein L3J18_02890 [Candidatus Brocadia sp.]|jgi:hypothetical protein|uniref:Uncharacterized protein n=1 Tax=Candidatus Brocadia fulgida TaxID=380242 RepID=A0A0M2UWJ7_9BACT|nr:MAG: hypothetical protein BROFUL_01347 [Candidatus Brocadia fulgida]UJS21274.1 MAG: hypothetical protein L3J18_02890 [Candidatus Brocadia sp.]